MPSLVRRTVSSLVLSAIFLAGFVFAARSVHAAPPNPPLRVGFSDWPGWTAFEIGIQKGWFKEAGVDVKFDWFEYAPSMDAFAAGKIDAVMMTTGDALVTGAPGPRSVAILVTDY